MICYKTVVDIILLLLDKSTLNHGLLMNCIVNSENKKTLSFLLFFFFFFLFFLLTHSHAIIKLIIMFPLKKRKETNYYLCKYILLYIYTHINYYLI